MLRVSTHYWWASKLKFLLQRSCSCSSAMNDIQLKQFTVPYMKYLTKCCLPACIWEITFQFKPWLVIPDVPAYLIIPPGPEASAMFQQKSVWFPSFEYFAVSGTVVCRKQGFPGQAGVEFILQFAWVMRWLECCPYCLRTHTTIFSCAESCLKSINSQILTIEI